MGLSYRSVRSKMRRMGIVGHEREYIRPKPSWYRGYSLQLTDYLPDRSELQFAEKTLEKYGVPYIIAQGMNGGYALFRSGLGTELPASTYVPQPPESRWVYVSRSGSYDCK